MTMYVPLDVQETATEEEIRSAYRRLAREYHPDVASSPNASKFDHLQQAYNVLGNSTSRAAYDEMLHRMRHQSFMNSSRKAQSPQHPAPNAPFQASKSVVPAKRKANTGTWFTGLPEEPSLVVWA